MLQPGEVVQTCHDLLTDDGLLILSTPYHGYWKNLALSVTNKWDHHHSPHWEGGHIKFFSIKGLGEMLTAAGFSDITFHRVGRVPPLAKSMIAVATRKQPLSQPAI